MMTLQQFQYMSQEDQHMLLNTRAIYLCSKKEPGAELTLFQLDGFYVEVCTSTDPLEADSIIYFDELDLLDPYFPLISLRPVYEILNGETD